MMDRPPGRIRPGGNVRAGQARPWRGVCGLLGICLVAAMMGSATLTGRDPPVPDRPARVGHAWLTGTGAARQTISFGQPVGTSPGAADTAVGALITVHASASSGLLVSFRSATPLVCTVSATIVTALTAGVCAITASQAGSAGFQPRPTWRAPCRSAREQASRPSGLRSRKAPSPGGPRSWSARTSP